MDAGSFLLDAGGALSCGGIDPVYTVYQLIRNYFTAIYLEGAELWGPGDGGGGAVEGLVDGGGHAGE